VDLTGRTFAALTVLRRDETVVKRGGQHVKWVCQCSICGNIKSVRGSDLVGGRVVDCGCGRSERLSKGLVVDLTGMTFGSLKVLRRDNTIGHRSGQHTKWICLCNLCGRTESVSSSFLRSGQKIMCHQCCKKSVSEKKISELLESHDIDFVRDKPYLDCINDRTGYHLRFDFIINSDGGVYMVEYDGLQHFKSAPMWDDNGDLEERTRRDAIKDRWCAQNSIPLIRIPYTELKNISIDDLRVETSRFLMKVE